MTAPRCSRCGQPFEMRCPDDRHCQPCAVAVAALIAADAKRRLPRFAVAKDLTGAMGLVL